jgi:Fur family ferric uptake transcriptional regulator
VINPSTIFRTLKLLVQAGIAQERQFANGNTKYDVNVAHHDHMICLKCGETVEFVDPRIEDLQEKMAKKHGFRMTDHRMEIFGLCPKCRKSDKGFHEELL